MCVLILYLAGSREYHDVIQEEFGVWRCGFWNGCATQVKVSDSVQKHYIHLLVCVCLQRWTVTKYIYLSTVL